MLGREPTHLARICVSFTQIGTRLCASTAIACCSSDDLILSNKDLAARQVWRAAKSLLIPNLISLRRVDIPRARIERSPR